MARITLRDVAQAAGTSVATVSAVLNANAQHNIRVSPATRQRILTAANELDYAPNLVARSLVTRKTGVLGLVFPYSSAFTEQNPFFTQVMAGVFETVVRAQVNVMLHTSVGESVSQQDEALWPDPRVDGLILVLPEPNSRIIERCYRRQFPFVCLVHQPSHPDLHAVNADEFTGGFLAAQHLIEAGHRRIAHLAGNQDVATALPRQQGYCAALERAGIALDPALIIAAGFSRQAGSEAAQRLLTLPASARPTALFCANDLCADGALRVLRAAARRVPQDISVVGYDDTWFATMTQPPLTSVHMPIFEMAVRATEMVIDLVEGRDVAERQPILPVHLTVRRSSGAPPLR